MYFFLMELSLYFSPKLTLTLQICGYLEPSLNTTQAHSSILMLFYYFATLYTTPLIVIVTINNCMEHYLNLLLFIYIEHKSVGHLSNHVASGVKKGNHSLPKFVWKVYFYLNFKIKFTRLIRVYLDDFESN